MGAAETSADAEAVARLSIPVGVAPSDANAVHAELVSAFATEGPVVLTLDGDGPLSPCALQLAVSVKRAAEAAGRAFRPAPEICAAFEALQFQSDEEAQT